MRALMKFKSEVISLVVRGIHQLIRRSAGSNQVEDFLNLLSKLKTIINRNWLHSLNLFSSQKWSESSSILQSDD